MTLFPVPDPDPDLVRVRVSVRSMLQRFHGCTPDYIADVCHGRCCDAPSRPGGTLVTIHPSEAAAVRARGGVVGDDNLLVTDGRCTFKTDEHLCGLHVTPDKPFGCIASPFTLNPSDCLIVRNRYRRLVCYGDPDWPPAYIAFRASLDRIFGVPRAEILCEMLELWTRYPTYAAAGPSMCQMMMPVESWRMLHDNDASKKAVT